jgi:hypothetical protein
MSETDKILYFWTSGRQKIRKTRKKYFSVCEQSECSLEEQVQNLLEFSSCWNPLEKWVGDCRLQRTGRVFFFFKNSSEAAKLLVTALGST